MKPGYKPYTQIALTAFALYIAIYYWSSISGAIGTFISSLIPLFAGFSVAYVLNILMSFYEKHYFTRFSHKPVVYKTRTVVCAIASLISLVGIIVLIIMLVLPELISCISFLLSRVPPMFDDLLESDIVIKYVPKDIVDAIQSIHWQDAVEKLIKVVATGITTAAGALADALSSALSVIITSFLSVIFAVYYMVSKEKLNSQSRRLLHTYVPKYESKILYVLSVLNDSFKKFIVGQCLEAVILWILCTIGMMIFGFPYAQMIGAFIGFTAIIPIAGPYIGSIVGAIMILTVSPIKALLFLVFIIILQQIEGNFIYPKVVGDSIGLPPVWVLAAITIGGGVMGIAGMLIGVPIFAAIYRIVKEDVIKREKKEKPKPAPTPQD